MPGLEVTDIETEEEDEGTVYVIEGVKDGKECELEVTEIEVKEEDEKMELGEEECDDDI